MINIFKSGGNWKTSDGKEYTVKTIEVESFPEYSKDGWVKTLEEVADAEKPAKRKTAKPAKRA